jgi:diguanylate cyclase (GGDEF)-like protein
MLYNLFMSLTKQFSSSLSKSWTYSLVLNSESWSLKSNFVSRLGLFLAVQSIILINFSWNFFLIQDFNLKSMISLFVNPLYLFICVGLGVFFWGGVGSFGVVWASELGGTKDEIKQLQDDSNIDPLTGLKNRRGMEGALKKWLQNGIESGKSSRVGCLFIDIDKFKIFNDTWGHAIGDLVLSEVAKGIKGTSRPTDIVGRWGGEEIIVLAAQTAEGRLERYAERIRKTIEELVVTAEGQNLSVTVSIGCAVHKNDESFEELIALADKNVYLAKKNGRNRVEPSPSF